MAVNACRRSEGTPPGPPRPARAGQEPGHRIFDRWDEPWVASSRSPCQGRRLEVPGAEPLAVLTAARTGGCDARRPAQPEPLRQRYMPTGGVRQCPHPLETAARARQRHGLRWNVLQPGPAPAEASTGCDADQPSGRNGTTGREPPARANQDGVQPDRQAHQRHELRHGTPHEQAADWSTAAAKAPPPRRTNRDADCQLQPPQGTEPDLKHYSQDGSYPQRLT